MAYGLTPQHLKNMLSEGNDNQLLEAVTAVTNIMLAGGSSQDTNEVVYGGKLIVLRKKDGGLRSIAIS